VWLSCSENGAVEVETVNPESAAGYGEMVAMILENCQKQNSILRDSITGSARPSQKSKPGSIPVRLHRSKIVPLANGRGKMHVSKVFLQQMLTAASGMAALMSALLCPAQQLTNDRLSADVKQDGSYQLAIRNGRPVLSAGVAAEVDNQWLQSSAYPQHHTSESAFKDDLGAGREFTVIFTGLRGKPDLVYALQLYTEHFYGTVQVKVRNSTGKDMSVQAIRSVDAIGQPIIELGGHLSADRVLSDSFSEDWPDLKIYDLGQAPNGMHRAVGSQLIYNRESKQSLFLGVLTSDRFLTIFHLQTQGSGLDTGILSYTVESTGTTEIQNDFDLKHSPPEDRVELSLPVKRGEEIASEKLLFAAGPDYQDQLLVYGDIIRRLHHARIPDETPIGWWSWTAYYGGINEGECLANAQWQAQHLLELGYKFFQIDDGYEYARGEFTTSNATQFPDGVGFVGHRITANGLTLGVWTAPFEVSARSWIYEHHKDWLVHNAKGLPIPIGKVWNQNTDVLYALDTTHPQAQEYMRQTYKTLVREWGVRFIKLDFMDTTAIEGYHYRPNTTALEAQRIGMEIIRDTVGNDVILDKDGSPMLNPVGLVDTGRISVDTGHNFQRTKNAAPGIAARFYMQRNFFLDDPDAFNVTDSYLMREPQPPVSLPAAQASIVLSAISGGMYEIGDDMLLLGSEKDRLVLVQNRDLLNMAKIGRASTPIDLLSYEPEDQQPSIFFLPEDRHQGILTVFNWTKKNRSRELKLAELGLPGNHSFSATDVLNRAESVAINNSTLHIQDQAPESVRVIKIVDVNIPEAAPNITAQVPSTVNTGELFSASAQADAAGVPAVRYHWDFGDGTHTDGAKVSHAYTREGEFTLRLIVDGVDGIPARKDFELKVSGHLQVLPELRINRRLVEPGDH
jgi:alpha-galactosidase